MKLSSLKIGFLNIVIFCLISGVSLLLPQAHAQDEFLQDELQKLEQIRNDASNNLIEVEKLKSILGDGIKTLEYLAKLKDELDIKLAHINTNISLKQSEQADLARLRTKLDLDVSEFKEIVNRLLVSGDNRESVPRVVFSAIENKAKEYMRLDREVRKRSKASAIVISSLQAMNTDTRASLSSISSSLQKYIKQSMNARQNIDILTEKVREMQAEESAIRNIVISLTSGQKAQIDTLIKSQTTGESTDSEQVRPQDYIWPVDPKEGLSAVFHDQSYQKVFGLEHLGIDIPIPSGTEVRAVADAVVLEMKEVTDDSYQYVVLAHLGNIQSVYGHLSSISVKKGDLIRQGDVIGLSGGIPGTRGAGPITTGAHLHLEIMKDGGNVDPLQFLH